MRKLAAVLLLFPIMAFAADRAPRLAILQGDGRSEKIVLPFDGARVRVVVEFTTAPLARMVGTRAAGGIRSQAAARQNLEQNLQRFRRDLASFDSPTTESSHGLSARSASPTIEYEYLNALSGAAVTLDAATLARVKALPYVSRVSFDGSMHTLSEPGLQPGVAAVHAPELWSARGTRGAGVTVAIIDTGIDYHHSALGGGFGPAFKVIGGYDFVNKDADPMDDHGHGTHVAGIVAGNSTELLGVAPDAKLIAFKVLNRDGYGSTSDIIAAIERCVDPNGDGDFSDRVDVANMSLGGFGNPDDPLSRAVDAAVQAGVVFAVAAGNMGAAQTILSPGAAEHAVTVGAIDSTGAIAFFSSRGPNALHYSSKPDVVAPGVNVLSAKMGGGVFEQSGTSMATPHVAGVAALLRAVHHDWSAEQVKSALMSTAQGPDLGVMVSGAGRVDALLGAAAAVDLLPQTLTFGIAGGVGNGATPFWSQHVSVSVKNRGDAPRTYVTSFTGTRAGIALTAVPPTVTLAPGETRTLDVMVNVDHTKLPFTNDGTISYSGFLQLDAQLDGGSERLHVPWSFAKGFRLHIHYASNDFVNVVFTPDRIHGFGLPLVGENEFETLVAPGTYDITVAAIPLGDAIEPAVLFYEQQDLPGDRTYEIDYLRDAPYVTNFVALDEAGVPITDFPRPGGCGSLRSVSVPGNAGIQFASFDGWEAVRTNALSESVSIVASDVCVEPSFTRLYDLEFEPVRGVSQSLVRFAGAQASVGQSLDVRVALPADGAGVVKFQVDSFINGGPAGVGMAMSTTTDSRRWKPTVYLTREYAGFPVRYVPKVETSSQGRGLYSVMTSAPLRVVDGKVWTFPGDTPSPTAERAGDVLASGAGAVLPQLEILYQGKLLLHSRMVGQLDELYNGGLPLTGALYDGSGTAIENDGDVTIDDLDHRVTYGAEGETHEIDGVAGRTSFRTTFGGPQFDKYGPVLTSLLLHDGIGRRLTDRVQRGAATYIAFSVLDDALDESKTTLRIRNSPNGAWTTLPVTVKGHDNGTRQSLGHDPRGTLYESEVLLFDKGRYDLEVSTADNSGNTTTAVMSPVFVVVEGKGRAAGH
jgi:subtilisin family serine protease